MDIEILVALALAALLALLVLVLRLGRNRDAGSSDPDPVQDPPESRRCPLCGEDLAPGERVHSTLTHGSDFDFMEIQGCRHCWLDGRHPRRCPACSAALPDDALVLARVYRREGRRPRVEVYGCTVCRPGRIPRYPEGR